MFDFHISEVLLPNIVDLNDGSFNDKDDLFHHMVSLLFKAGKVKSEEEFLKSLYEREDMGSTYMGNYIAIPHGKSETVTSPTIAFCRCSNGVLYESNGEVGTAKIIFMLAIPKSVSSNDYIRILSTLSRLLIYDEFVEKIYKSQNYEDLISAIKTAESMLSE